MRHFTGSRCAWKKSIPIRSDFSPFGSRWQTAHICTAACLHCAAFWLCAPPYGHGPLSFWGKATMQQTKWILCCAQGLARSLLLCSLGLASCNHAELRRRGPPTAPPHIHARSDPCKRFSCIVFTTMSLSVFVILYGRT